MNKLSFILSFFALTFFSSLNAQIYNPVKWTSSSKQIGDDEYELTWTAKIDAGWYIYSQYIGPDDGPSATLITYENPNSIKLIGKNIEGGHLKKKFDEIWGVEISKFNDLATFKQKIKVLDDSKPITGYLNFQTCDNSKCLPPTDYEFSFNLKNKKSGMIDPNAPKETKMSGAELDKADPGDFGTRAPETTSDDTGIEQPVKWTAKIDKDKNGQSVVTLNANIEKGWHIYSQDIKGDGQFQPASP